MITISNGILTARINEKGAELKSLTWNGEERIFPGDPNYWTGSAPILFPVCSGLKEETYRLNGKSYHMGKHGFARFQLFTVESAEADEATFLLRDNEETRAQYPYSFELRVIFKLSGQTLKVEYRVTNRSTEKMYFSIGAHEAYYCPEGIEKYEVILPENETLDSSVLEGPILGNQKRRVITDRNVIPLNYSDYEIDALVFKSIKARNVILKQKESGKATKLTFEGFPYFLLWTKPNAPYICMEPWCGISDSVDFNGDFSQKEGIESIDPGKTFTRTHKIEMIR